MDLVEICRAKDEYEAALIGAVLEETGIEYMSRGEALGRIYGIFTDGLGEVPILVRANDRNRAIEAIAEARKAGASMDELLPPEGPGDPPST